MKRTVPLQICFWAGLTMVVQYYVESWRELGQILAEWCNIIAAFGFVLGAASLLVVNGKKIQRRASGWQYNAALLVALLATLGLGLLPRGQGHLPTDEGTAFNWVFQYVYTPLSSTTYSLLAFFIASAAFRAFRAKSVESTLLLVTALIVIVFRVPAGEALLPGVPVGQYVEDIIMGGFSTAGQRAVLLGASIGLISVSLKIILGIERSYLGGD